MQTTIYNYLDEPVNIEVRDINEICFIAEKILSGDEVVTFYYKDGTRQTFDAYWDGIRHIGYHDGDFLLKTPEQIQAWFDFDEDGEGGSRSYARLYKMKEIING